MIDNYPEVKKAHVDDELLFGTVESWVVYVGDAVTLPVIVNFDIRTGVEPDWRARWRHSCWGCYECIANSPHEPPYIGMG